MTSSRKDRVRGCILGSIVGDAFGGPLEGASPEGISSAVERRATSRRPWGYSDDGAMVLACAEALTSCGTIEPVELLRAVARRYEPARGFGRGMKIAIAAFSSGSPWDECAFAAWPEGSRGNGGAVRIAPVAAARWPTAGAFDLAVHLAARITHAHPEALAFARLQAVVLSVALHDPALVGHPEAFRAAMIARLGASSELVVKKVDTVFELVASNASPAEAGRVLGTSTIAAESVPAALWAFVSQHRSFAEAVSFAALLGGDVDSICCLVGALAGAQHGADGIDRDWLENLSREQPTPAQILALADAVHDLEPTPPEPAG